MNPGTEITLTLTRGQVARVLADTGAGEGDLFVLMGVQEPREVIDSPLLDDPKISKSLLLGLMVLKLPGHGTGVATRRSLRSWAAGLDDAPLINTLVAVACWSESVTRACIAAPRHGYRASGQRRGMMHA
jgi:hypothetical protein